MLNLSISSPSVHFQPTSIWLLSIFCHEETFLKPLMTSQLPSTMASSVLVLFNLCTASDNSAPLDILLSWLLEHRMSYSSCYVLVFLIPLIPFSGSCFLPKPYILLLFLMAAHFQDRTSDPCLFLFVPLHSPLPR